MVGSPNASEMMALINTVDANKMVSGSPGNFSISLLHSAAEISSFTIDGPTSGVANVALVNGALAQSNAAAQVTPSAASGTATKTNTTQNIVQGVVNGLRNLSNPEKILRDVQDLEAGSTATLHWWGWSLALNETATVALVDLLSDVSSLTAICVALGPVSAPLAAVTGIIGIILTGLETWIKDADEAHKRGVTLNGLLWVAVTVESN